MNDQREMDALVDVKTAIRDASNLLLAKLKEERDRTDRRTPLPIASGLRLAYVLGQMPDDQRKALLVGAQLSENERELVVGLLREVAPSEPTTT